MADKALYYPYIHIHDVNWLKSTLLLFNEVRRIVPVSQTPLDADDIKPFAEYRHELGRGLLGPARLREPRVVKAQLKLAKKLDTDAERQEFRDAFGIDAARAVRVDFYGFQMHYLKLERELREVLKKRNLSWPPDHLEPHDHDGGYIEVHPRIGEAIMATLAIACATSEGLDIVGDDRSGELHECIIGKKMSDVYRTWIDQALEPETELTPERPTAEDVLEYFVFLSCDVSEVTADSVAKLGDQREAFRDLVKAVGVETAKIEAMDPGPELYEKFDDAMSKVRREWKRRKIGLSSLWRNLLNVEPADSISLGGGLMASSVGMDIGVLAGLVLHSGLAGRAMVRGARNSPYRYLTEMQKAGVVFRREIRGRRK